jgi:hypothetical protein
MRAGNLRALQSHDRAHGAQPRLYGTLELDGLDRLRADDPQLILRDLRHTRTRLAARLTSRFPGIGRDLATWD